MSKRCDDSDDWDDWGELNFREPEGFGLENKQLPRHPSQTGPEYAAARLKAFISEIDALELLTLPMRGKKDCQVVKYLHINRHRVVTLNDLRDHTEDRALTPDAIRKTIEEINKTFLNYDIPLLIEKERINKDAVRVWLKIII